MTLKRNIQSTCPVCGTNNEIEIFESINLNINPELFEKIKNRDINKAVCDCCGADGELYQKFLLVDNERNFWVTVYNELFRDQKEDALENDEIIYQEALRIVGPHACPVFHVFGYTELFDFLRSYDYDIS